MDDDLKFYLRSLEATRIRRRQLLNEVIADIEQDEARHNKRKTKDWTYLGPIERQCDLLIKLLDQLKTL